MTAAGFPYHLNLCLLAQHSRETATSAALGAPPAARELEDALRPEEMDSVTPVPMATLMQTYPQAATPAGTCSFAQVASQLPLLKTLQMAGILFVTWPQAPSKGGPACLPDELLQL